MKLPFFQELERVLGTLEPNGHAREFEGFGDQGRYLQKMAM